MGMTWMNRYRWMGAFVALLVAPMVVFAADEPKKDRAAAGSKTKISYDKQIRPIFQAQCQGCHQPAKAGGGYVMTAFDRLLKGGESDDAGDRRRASPRRATSSSRSRPTRTARPRCPRTSRRCRPARSS